MRSNRIRLGLFASALFVLALCVSSVALNAQTYTEGAIAGTVFDSTGAVVPGAAISIVNNGTNAADQPEIRRQRLLQGAAVTAR